MSTQPTIVPIQSPSKNAPSYIPNQPKQEEKKKNTKVFKLPSQGYFYPEESPLASGEIELKFVTAKHEDILSSQNFIKKGIVIDEFLKSVIFDPKIKLEDLLVGDKNAIFVFARILAYGKDYEIKQKCPACGEENQVVVDLDKLSVKEIDFEKFKKNVNLFQYTFPNCQREILFKLSTHKDEQDVDVELKSLAKVTKNSSSPTVTTTLKKMIVSVDGKEDKGYIKSFIEKELPSVDSAEFRKYLKTFMPDVDMTYDFTCDSCGHTQKLSIPIGVNFLWPDVNS